MTETERGLGHRWFEEVWNQGRRESIAEMASAEVVIHDGAQDSAGPAAFYEFYDRMRATFTELQVTVHDTIAEGDLLCIRWSCTAKHTGGGLGMPASGKSLQVTGISIFRIAGGQVVEAWQNWDMLGMHQQIQGGQAATYIAKA
jgi:steroid delta-isomerase-like uncharacterized protein